MTGEDSNESHDSIAPPMSASKFVEKSLHDLDDLIQVMNVKNITSLLINNID